MVKEALNRKKEILLNLKHGELDTFTTAIKRIASTENSSPSEFFENEETVDETEDSIEHETSSQVLLDLERMDTCRICLQDATDLISISEKSREFDWKISDLIEFCLQVKVQGDNLPQKICLDCLKSVEIACNLKNDFQESQLIMEECKVNIKLFEVPESEDFVDPYCSEDNSCDTETHFMESAVEAQDVEMNDDYYEVIETHPEEETITTSNRVKSQSKYLIPKKCYL